MAARQTASRAHAFREPIFGTRPVTSCVNARATFRKTNERTSFCKALTKLGAIGGRNPCRKRNANVVRAIAEPIPHQADVTIKIDNEESAVYTTVTVSGPNRPGLLTALSGCFKDLALDVRKADIDGENGAVIDKFYVQTEDGRKVTDEEELEQLRVSLEAIMAVGRRSLSRTSSKRPQVVPRQEVKNEILLKIKDTYKENDVLSIQSAIVDHLEYTLARNRFEFDSQEAYSATSLTLRDRLIESFNDTSLHFRRMDPKRVYYLSMEFLMGRSLTNALGNLGLKSEYTEALHEMGCELEELVEKERDAALGNGGLGRLAACFLDSMATLNLPAWGYGIRYQYGMFRQTIVDGFQHEQPDYWLNFGNPWELERFNVFYPIKFFGHVSVQEENGRQVFKWNPGETVMAVAYDMPIPGYRTRNTINLRLWASRPDREFDLQAFNTGDYVQAILARQRAETMSSVLYPDDRTYQGKELRLKQQQFFVSATIQDVVRRYKDVHGTDFSAFPEKVAFQLNDTHPTIAVPELMRLLMDENGLGWTRSWEICSQVFAFTNHTVLPEALEKWPVSLMEKLLPRHLQIIYDINWRFLQNVRTKYGEDAPRLARMSIIEDGTGDKYVRMAYLAVVASHTVNGVADIHSNIIRHTIFKDFYEMWPEKFQNKTNGVTPRRWLAFCNPPLCDLLTSTLGTDKWITNLPLLQGLRKHVDDAAFREKWREMKRTAKLRALKAIEQACGTGPLREDALLDIQVKRIHEYKRQLLNIMGIIWRYDQIKKMSPEQRAQVVPRVCVIGGKAAPGYEMAKRIIKLVSAVGAKINNDPDIGDLLKVHFVPDYNVSLAEVLIPGSELNQQISTAGTEASGTGNMKFAMNGSLIIGTMDGANVEIAQEIGEENMFIFGVRAPDVPRLRTERRTFKPDPRFDHVVSLIRKNVFGWSDFFDPLCDSITVNGDYYLLANDFPSYIEAQEKVDKTYKDPDTWVRMSILSTAGSGFFSSDRTIQEYAEQIWRVQPCAVPDEELQTTAVFDANGANELPTAA